MLECLTLKDFAIIDDLSIDFGPGLNIITGETGTGKSIIVDAITIILGGKVSADIIRKDRDQATVEALLDLSANDGLKELLGELGFPTEGDELLLKRVVPRVGRAKLFVNGSHATLNMIDRIAESAVDVFSQHEHQTLYKESIQLRLLDGFGGLDKEVDQYKELYKEYSDVKRALSDLKDNETNDINREEFLRFQLNEIESCSLNPGEDKELVAERNILLNAERIFSVTERGYNEIYDKDQSILGNLKNIHDELRDISHFDPRLDLLAKSVEKTVIELEELSSSLREYTADVKIDTVRLEEVEDRLEVINNLKRKHGDTIEEILQTHTRLSTELDSIANYGEHIEELENKLGVLEKKANDKAASISRKRRDAGKKLSKRIETELGNVGIKHAQFQINVSDCELSATGIDRVEYQFSANPDEKPRKLSSIASGGELSRIMLVLKQALTKTQGGSVVIFDEADSGVGGAVAEAVGIKIKELSKRHQVLCITHLPQVAKFADTHLRVSKSFEKQSTNVRVDRLDNNDRVSELARMLGGIKITDKTVEAARELIAEQK